MDSTLAAAYIAAGAAIIGVILGSVITGVGNWRDRSRRRENVRRVLSWEHAYNLRILEEFWKKVHQEDPLQVQHDPTKEFERNLRFSEEHLDIWGHQMWQSYASEVASVLSEDEFNQSYQLHSALDAFASRRKSLIGILHGDFGTAGIVAYNNQKTLQSHSPGAYVPNDTAAMNRTNAGVRPLWNECMRLYTICQQIGNPIPSESNRGKSRKGV